MPIDDWVDPALLDIELDVVRAEFAAADAAIALLPGPAGPPGADGDTGPQGVPGPEGPAGGGGGFADMLAATIDTGQNVNTTSTLAITQDAVNGTGLTVTGNTIVVAFTGWVTLSYGIVIAGAVTRAVPQITVQRTGTPVPGLTARHTYIRNSSGQTESSANATNVALPVTTGDVLTLTTAQLAGTGTVTTQAGSGISIRRVG